MVVVRAVTAPLVSFHVAAHTERLAAANVRALERLFARVRVAVDTQGARPRESLVACLADVTLLRLREGGSGRWRDVVMVLPGVGTR